MKLGGAHAPGAPQFLSLCIMRPHLKYAAPAWSPYIIIIKDINSLESVQSIALKVLKLNSGIPAAQSVSSARSWYSL